MKFLPIAVSGNGVNAIVAPIPGKRIRVIHFALSFSAAVNAKWQSSVAPTDLTGLIYGNTDTTFISPYAIEQHFAGMGGLFETISGEGLNLNLSAGVPVGGYLVYDERQ